MARALPIAEDFTPRTLTGTATLSAIELTGWGAVTTAVPALKTYTDRGRLWWRFTASSNLLEFFRRATLASGDRVAYTSSAVSGGKATLVQDNSSGFSGTLDIDEGTQDTNPVNDATGDVIVSYAHENDLVNAYAAVTNYLDSNSKWYAQNTRFEAVLRQAKRELDEELAGILAPQLSAITPKRRQLAVVADPRQLSLIHAYFTLGVIERHRAGHGERFRDAADRWFSDARGLLRVTQIALDFEADDAIDTEANVSSANLLLG